MSADVLREAAALMRERAASVPPGRWESGECEPQTQAEHRALGMYSVVFSDEKVICPIPGFSGERKASAEYMASWHPAVALAVADWLGACALVTEVAPDRHKGLALAVARAYLGSES